MPLSEHEQRILQNIEKSFYESDPKFARAVSNNSFNHAARNCKLAALGFGISFVILLIMFSRLPIAGMVGFVGMVGSTAVFLQNLRRVLRPHFQESERVSLIEEFKSKLRRRFRRS